MASTTQTVTLPKERELSALLGAVLDFNELRVAPIRQRVIEVIALGCDGDEQLDRVEVSDEALVDLVSYVSNALEFLGDATSSLEVLCSSSWIDELREIARGRHVAAVPNEVADYRQSDAFMDLLDKLELAKGGDDG